MTLTVLLLAAAHAIPIFAAAWFLNSKPLLWVVAAVMVVVAFQSGGAVYTFFDLAAIGIALWNCLIVVQRRIAKAPRPVVQAGPGRNASGGYLLLGSVLVCFFWLTTGDEKPKAGNAPVPLPLQTQTNGPTKVSAPVPTPPSTASSAKPRAATRKAATVEDCLRISDETRMAKCLETAK